MFRLLLAIPSWLKDKGAHQQLARGVSELLKCGWSVFKDTHEFKGMPGFATEKYKLKIEKRHVTRNCSLHKRWAKAIRMNRVVLIKYVPWCRDPNHRPLAVSGYK